MLVKPSTWIPQPSLIAPELRSLASKLTWGGPINSRGYIITGGQYELPSSFTGTVPRISTIGTGIHVNTNTDRFEYLAAEGAQWGGDINFTIGIVFSLHSGSGDVTSGMFAARSAATAGYWNLYYTSSNLVFSGDGITSRFFASGNLRDDAIHVMIMRRSRGGNYTMWLDGRNLGTLTDASVPTTGSHPVVLGHIQTGVDWDFANCSFYGAFVWKNFAPTDPEMEIFCADPFGPFRYVPRMFSIVEGRKKHKGRSRI